MSTPLTSRDRILAKLRGAAPQPVTKPDVAAYYQDATPKDDAATLTQRFRQLIELAHAEVHPVTEANWPDTLRRLCAEKSVRRLLLGNRTAHGERFTEHAALHQADLTLSCYDRPVDDWKDELFLNIDAGFTRARSAIAATGTLVLWPDASEPRLLSLVPPIHFVLLDARCIHPDLFTTLRREGWANGLPTNALLISGPSKTADIQQTLAYGAHGPKELVILLLNSECEGAGA